MTTRLHTALTGGLLALMTTVSLTADRGAPQAALVSGEGLPEGPGKAVTVRVCGLCHEPRRAASVRLTREGWEAVVDSMVKRGAKGTEEELATVTDYLATHFLGEAAKPVNVNSAPQIDLELVAGLLRSEARAVVEYRTKNGPFMTLDDMKKVPGLNFSKIDSSRDFLVAMVLGTPPQ
jgi:competence protein ComEA